MQRAGDTGDSAHPIMKLYQPQPDHWCYGHRPWHIVLIILSMAISGTDLLELPAINRAYFFGKIPTKYGQKYGTNVPPSVGSWRSPIDIGYGSKSIMCIHHQGEIGVLW